MGRAEGTVDRVARDRQVPMNVRKRADPKKQLRTLVPRWALLGGADPRARRTLKEPVENVGHRARFLFHPKYFQSVNELYAPLMSAYGSCFLLKTLHMVGSKTMNEIIPHTPEP